MANSNPQRRSASLVEHAPAKINLTLAVLGRRADGYHSIDSLVTFADIGDRLSFVPGNALSLVVSGSTAKAAGPLDDNLVLKVARGVGADVPVCVDPRPRRMRGIGEMLSPPLAIPTLLAVLVNPGVAVPTKDVFAALGLERGQSFKRAGRPWRISRSRTKLIEDLAAGRNDLEPPAIKLRPVIGRVLEALRQQPGCELARMSGSGATCFGLFASQRAAAAAARSLGKAHPRWWVKPTVLG